MTYCPICNREIVWGRTLMGQELIFDAHPERRYFFLSKDLALVRDTDTYVPHKCYDETQGDPCA